MGKIPYKWIGLRLFRYRDLLVGGRYMPEQLFGLCPPNLSLLSLGDCVAVYKFANNSSYGCVWI